MNHVIRFHQTGGPEVLRFEPAAVGAPGPGEVHIRQAAIGVNYVDNYYRSGLYPVALPSGLGSEGAGVVVAMGEGVSELAPGDRVAYAQSPLGAYAEERLIPADRLVPLPPEIDFETAAGMMLRGLTAHYLIHRTYRVEPGDTILVHAAAGGVGLLLCQWASRLGATVIGTVGSDEKAALAAANGCAHPINYSREDFVARVRELTHGAKLPVVYDSIGKDTFYRSLDCLRPLGLLVSYGQASGPIGPVDIGLLAQKGSLYLTRPTLHTYIERREDLAAAARDLFAAVKSGVLRIQVNQRYALRDAADAHRALQSRKTTGSTILIP